MHPVGGERRMIDGFQDGNLASEKGRRCKERGFPKSQDRRSKGRAGKGEGEKERRGEEYRKEGEENHAEQELFCCKYETASDSKRTDADGLSRRVPGSL